MKESLVLFEDMKKGKFDEGEVCVMVYTFALFYSSLPSHLFPSPLL